jgi:hypothetical protein
MIEFVGSGSMSLMADKRLAKNKVRFIHSICLWVAKAYKRINTGTEQNDEYDTSKTDTRKVK